MIRSIFRIPRSVLRYVKLVFLFFYNEAKTLRNQNDVLTLEIIDRWLEAAKAIQSQQQESKTVLTQ